MSELDQPWVSFFLNFLENSRKKLEKLPNNSIYYSTRKYIFVIYLELPSWTSYNEAFIWFKLIKINFNTLKL